MSEQQQPVSPDEELQKFLGMFKNAVVPDERKALAQQFAALADEVVKTLNDPAQSVPILKTLLGAQRRATGQGT